MDYHLQHLYNFTYITLMKYMKSLTLFLTDFVIFRAKTIFIHILVGEIIFTERN